MIKVENTCNGAYPRKRRCASEPPQASKKIWIPVVLFIFAFQCLFSGSLHRKVTFAPASEKMSKEALLAGQKSTLRTPSFSSENSEEDVQTKFGQLSVEEN